MLREEMVENLREYDRARAEAHHERREVYRDYRQARPAAYWDDRRDVRDDHRDIAQERRTVKELQNLRNRLFFVRGKMTRSSMATRDYVIDRLLDLGRREQRQNWQEYREDRRELREDGYRADR
jgi:hypothetical protein